MAGDQPDFTAIAHRYARTAHEGFAASARYFRSLPDDAWDGPTGCAKWNMRALADHIVGEAVWFPNLVRGATRGEEPYPAQLYEDLKQIPAAELADRTETSAADIEAAVGEATPEQLHELVDLGFMKMPIWQATSISAMEASLHNWDARARREQNAAIPREWAQTVATIMPGAVPFLAHQKAAQATPGVYLLQVSDGVGAITITSRDGRVTAAEGDGGAADATLYLTADQYVRLLSGRLDLSSPESEGIRIEGDRDKALALNRIFAGIANE